MGPVERSAEAVQLVLLDPQLTALILNVPRSRWRDAPPFAGVLSAVLIPAFTGPEGSAILGHVCRTAARIVSTGAGWPVKRSKLNAPCPTSSSNPSTTGTDRDLAAWASSVPLSL